MNAWFQQVLTKFDTWALIGLVGQLVFMSRFLVQWYESEKRKESVVPVSFWWISIAGSVLVLAYGIQHAELVVILGQAFGFVVYIRNLMLIYAKRAALAAAVPAADAPEPALSRREP